MLVQSVLLCSLAAVTGNGPKFMVTEQSRTAIYQDRVVESFQWKNEAPRVAANPQLAKTTLVLDYAAFGSGFALILKNYTTKDNDRVAGITTIVDGGGIHAVTIMNDTLNAPIWMTCETSSRRSF